MNAINSNGEASRAAIQSLATMLGQDYNTVNSSLQNVLSVLNNIGAQQGMNALQVINAIQSGNADPGAQKQPEGAAKQSQGGSEGAGTSHQNPPPAEARTQRIPGAYRKHAEFHLMEGHTATAFRS